MPRVALFAAALFAAACSRGDPPALRAAMQNIDPDEDRALVKMIEALAEKKLGAEIWDPLAKGAEGKP